MLSNLHSTSNYAQECYSFLRQHEAYVPAAYADPLGIPTIGIGYNLREHLSVVLQTFGFDTSGQQLTGQAWQAEQYYMQQMQNIVNKNYPATSAGTQQLRNDLNAQLQARANDARYSSSFSRRTTFAFTNEAESMTVFNAVIGTYETNVDNWLGYHMADSKERIVLVSLAYNSRGGATSLLGSKLKAAITNDNRAEAWYEIRYNSNKNGIHASRRYAEAHLFGLYDSGSTFTEAEAKEVLRMYTKHQLQETDVTKTMKYYEQKYPSSEYADIDTDIKPAKDYLIDNFAKTKGVTIDGEIIVGAGLQSYEYLETWSIDKIEGTDKNELILRRAA